MLVFLGLQVNVGSYILLPRECFINVFVNYWMLLFSGYILCLDNINLLWYQDTHTHYIYVPVGIVVYIIYIYQEFSKKKQLLQGCIIMSYLDWGSLSAKIR